MSICTGIITVRICSEEAGNRIQDLSVVFHFGPSIAGYAYLCDPVAIIDGGYHSVVPPGTGLGAQIGLDFRRHLDIDRIKMNAMIQGSIRGRGGDGRTGGPSAG